MDKGHGDGKWNRNKKKLAAAGVLFAVSFFMLFVAGRVTGAADWYSEHIYPVFVASVGRVFGLVPFSAAEIGLYLLVIYIAGSFVVAVAHMVGKKAWREALVGWLASLCLIAGVLFFLYTANCGINYERNSFSRRAQIQTRQYTSSELAEVCRWLTEEVNKAAPLVKRDGQGLLKLDEQSAEGAANAMGSLGKMYTDLGGYYPRPKRLFNPWILSVQQLSGVYAPFTAEANYNNAMTAYNIPFTMCHELSHLRGFMQEEEANFIAWLACSMSDRADFQYSGKLMGWIYCMNVLEKVDYDVYQEIRAELAPQIEPDLTANREFWAQYDGKIAEVSNQVNDTYLKANGQEDGVKSYDRMVDLVVAYYYRT